MDGPLKGFRVLDLSTFLAAPTTGRLFAEWGSEVIKIEPMNGDTYRTFGPTMAMPITEKANPNFDTHNAHKNFVALNMRTPQGMEALHRLLATADVFLTNTRTKALDAMGLTWEELHRRYPRLIFAHILGYGEFGPRKDTPGFDYTAFWSRGGMLVDVAPAGGPPCNTLVGMGDHAVSLAIVAATCAALLRRGQTGQGEKVDASLLQLACWLNMSSINTAFYGRKLSRTHFEINQAQSNSYKCKDGEWIYIAATDYNKLFRRLCTEVFGRPELADDPRFCTRELSLKNKKELIEIYDEIFATKTRDEWDHLLSKADISHELCQHIGDLVADPQVTANNYVYVHEYEDGTKVPVTPPPVHFGSIVYFKYQFQQAKPIGADNDRYLKEVGYSEEEINTMRAQGQIV